jgi:peptide deformylase
MKRIFVLSAALLLSLSAYLQYDIELDFGILQNGSQLVLDSVLIENQTTGQDTMIYNANAGFTTEIIAGLNQFSISKDKLTVDQNYPNPFAGLTNIDVYVPGSELLVKMYDSTGKMLHKEIFNTGKGMQTFEFCAGSCSQYFINFSCDGQEQSLKLTNTSSSAAKPTFKFIGKTEETSVKSVKSSLFHYYSGDILCFTGYVTACQNVENVSLTDSPNESQTYNFDFTYIAEIQPDSPEIGEVVISETNILWDWSDVNGALGYKYNYIDEYSTASDLLTETQMLQEELVAGTNYELFVWAYNECGESFSKELNKATTALPLTQSEIDLILSGSNTTAMELMDICEQPDSIILRALSTNVIIGEENLQQLTDRMKKTVLGTGVGIAAPQVGINRRIIWVQRYDIGSAVHPWGLYFNPRIVNYSDTIAVRNDGCLSVNTACENAYGIEGNSYRALWIDVEYYLADGTYVLERINQQYTAHIFQHEIDHLDGIMFFDRQVEENPGKFVVVKGESYKDLPKID